MVGDYLKVLERDGDDVLPFVFALLRGWREASTLDETEYLARLKQLWKKMWCGSIHERSILRSELVGMLWFGFREFVPAPPDIVLELADRLNVPRRPWHIWRRASGNPGFTLAVGVEEVMERARELVSGPGRESYRANRGEHYPRALLERLSREFQVSPSTIRRRLVEGGFRLPDDLRFRRRKRRLM